MGNGRNSSVGHIIVTALADFADVFVTNLRGLQGWGSTI